MKKRFYRFCPLSHGRGALLGWMLLGLGFVCGGQSVYAADSRIENMQGEPVSKFIKGTVYDKKTKETLPGVNVGVYQGGRLVKGVSTDLDGKYSIAKPTTGAFEVRFTLMGYKQIIIEGEKLKSEMDIRMEEDAKEMGEVVINGYFAKDKNSFTGAVKQISSVELKQVSSTSVISAISALTPGMAMVQNTQMGSNPNKVPELILRGMSSFSNEDQQVNQPTIILDGTEISMQDLYDLDMNEIESINILKDASATALYGSKAANGVIVITRKPIQESTIRVAYNFTGNTQFPILGDYNVLNAAQKLEYERLAGLYDAKGAIDSETNLPLQYKYDQLYNERYQIIRRGQNSDWLSLPARNSFSHDHSLRIYGGATNLRYELTGRYSDTKGVMKGDYRHRYNLGFKLSYFVNNKLQISNRASYSEVSTKDSPYGQFSVFTEMNPYDAIYNADGSVNMNLAWDLDNPLYEAVLGSYGKDGTRSFSNTTDFRWDINKEFRLTGHFNIVSDMGWEEDYKSPKSREFKKETDLSKRGRLDLASSRGMSYSGNLVASYNKFLKDESLLSLTGGWEINHSKSKQERTQAIGFFNDVLSFIGNAAGYPASEKPFGIQSELSDVGFFLNGTYSFRNRYYADATYRTTGSSQFGENNRFGHFWSTGLAWNIRNEKFMDAIRDKVDLMKLRASAGYTGKVSFSPFQAITMYEYKNTYEYKNGIGAIPLTIGNLDLSWERTMTYNVGIDLSFFNRRLNLVLDAYIKQTKDLLLDKSKAPSTGVTSAKENIGELQNKGIEYQLDGFVFQTRDFYWKLGTMGYVNRNKVTKLSSALEEMNRKNQENARTTLTPLAQYAEGESVTALKLVRSAGIDPATGKEIYIKKNGELTFTYDPADKVLIGDTEPAFTGTVNTAIYYKGVSLYALFSIRYGAWLYNTTRVSKVEGSNPKKNADQRVFDDRWKQPGDVALYKDIAETSRPMQTDRFAEKENTFTLSSLNLSYEFPEKICSKLRVHNLRVGINATDLFRLSTVKIERGTTYLYSKGFEITLNTVF